MRYTIYGVVMLAVVAGIWFVSGSPGQPRATGTPQSSASTAPVSPTSTDGPASSPSPTQIVASPTQKSGTFTMAQVTQHDTQTSCYSVINGNVYDLTTYIPKHPGGPQKILAICGKDGTSLFERQHDSASKQADILETFKIGVLAK